MLSSLHSGFSVSIIVVTSVLFILFFVEHVDGSMNYLIPATQVKPIQQADGSMAYEISSTTTSTAQQPTQEKATNYNRLDSRRQSANNQAQSPAPNANKATPTSTLPTAPLLGKDAAPVRLPSSISLDEPYVDADNFVWPVKLPSKYSNRPKPTTTGFSGLPLRLPSTLPSPIIDNSATGSEPSTGIGPSTGSSSPATTVSPTPTSQTNSETLPTLPDSTAASSPTILPTVTLPQLPNSPADTRLPTLPDLSADSNKSPAITSPADTTLPTLPDLSANTNNQSPAVASPAVTTLPAVTDSSAGPSQSPGSTLPADTLPTLPDLSADSSQAQIPVSTDGQASSALPTRLPSSTSS